jgi:hypothetical protein
MSASCRLLGVAVPAVARSVKLDPRGLFLPGPCMADRRGLLDRGFTSKYAGEHAPSRRQRMLRRACVPSANPPGCERIPLAAATIGSAGIILRSSTACSVTRYLPRTASFMHWCATSILRTGRAEYAGGEPGSTRTRD